MTDDRALREKLDAMVREKRKDAATYPEWREAQEAVALDLLREKEERETECVWVPNELGARWAECGHGSAAKYPPRFCPGCGHPVQVKQNEEK